MNPTLSYNDNSFKKLEIPLRWMSECRPAEVAKGFFIY